MDYSVRKTLAVLMGIAITFNILSVDDIGAEDVSRCEGGLLFCYSRYSRDQLGQRGPDSEQGQGDHPLVNVQDIPRDNGTVIDEHARPDCYRRGAQNK